MSNVATKYNGPIFDSDSHIYEPMDCSAWNHYLPEKFKKDWSYSWRVGADGEDAQYIGDRKIAPHAGYNTIDGRVSPPGRLHEWLRATKNGEDIDMRVPMTPDMLEPEARLRKLDEFGVEGALVYIGNHVASLAYLDQVDARYAVNHSYNRWFSETWGFVREDRMYCTPVLSLDDIDQAVEEAKFVVKAGARIVQMPMGPYNNKAPADPAHDRFWAILNEAKVNVVFHVGEADCMYGHMRSWGEKPMQSGKQKSAFTFMHFYSERPVVETLTSFVFYNFFERFPNVKLLTAENGAEWVPGVLRKMDKCRGLAKNGYWPCGQLKTRPSEIFKKNVYVVAYPEDDIRGIIDQTGSYEYLVMGSDYPHSEGVPEPRDFIKEACSGLNDAELLAVMHDNGRRFMPKVL